MENPIEVLKEDFANVTNAEIKEAITAKFGSIAHFCRLTKRDVDEVYERLRFRPAGNTGYLEEVFEDAKRIAKTEAPGYHLTEANRAAMQAKLLRYGSTLEFCEAHKNSEGKPIFSNVFISRVINGKTEKITRKIKQLATLLEVNI